MKRNRILLTALIALCALALSGCCLKHEWNPATCTEPSTCAKCGETEGEPLGHSWAEATCTDPKTCTVCAAAEGEALGHTEGEWEELSAASLIQPGEQRKTCTVCGEELAREEIPQKTVGIGLVSYTFTPAEFVDAYNLTAGDKALFVPYRTVSDGVFYYNFKSGTYDGSYVSITPDEEGNAMMFCFCSEDIDLLYELSPLVSQVLTPDVPEADLLAGLKTQDLWAYVHPEGTSYVMADLGDGYYGLLVAPATYWVALGIVLGQ